MTPERYGVLRWQALRFAGPLREIAAREEAGPIPLAAAHAVDGLQALLEVTCAGQAREEQRNGIRR